MNSCQGIQLNLKVLYSIVSLLNAERSKGQSEMRWRVRLLNMNKIWGVSSKLALLRRYLTDLSILFLATHLELVSQQTLVVKTVICRHETLTQDGFAQLNMI